jgi:hypothetical protein
VFLTILFPLLVAVLSSAVQAQEHVYPPVCPDGERADLCEIKIQRNDGWDQVAIDKQKEAAMKKAEEKLAGWWSYYANGAARTAEYWEHYVSGINDLAANHPAGELEWWRSYARGMDQQVMMWKELCAKHHCSHSGY